MTAILEPVYATFATDAVDAETADFNRKFEHAFSDIPLLYTLDPQVIRDARAAGEGVFGPIRRIESAQDRMISNANHPVPVRKTAEELIAPRGAELAVRWTKQIMHRPLVDEITASLDLENEALKKAFGSADFREALAARAGKRAPAFKGQ